MAKVFSTSGLGGALRPVTVLRSARAALGSVAGRWGGRGPWDAPPPCWAPRGGSVPSCHPCEWRPLALALEERESRCLSPKDRTLLEVSSYSSVVCKKTRKSHLLAKPKESEVQRPPLPHATSKQPKGVLPRYVLSLPVADQRLGLRVLAPPDA